MTHGVLIGPKPHHATGVWSHDTSADWTGRRENGYSFGGRREGEGGEGGREGWMEGGREGGGGGEEVGRRQGGREGGGRKEGGREEEGEEEGEEDAVINCPYCLLKGTIIRPLYMWSM